MLSRVQLHRLAAPPSSEAGEATVRLPGRYRLSVAALTAVHAFGVAWNSPGRNVVTIASGGLTGWLPRLSSRYSPPPTTAATASTPPHRYIERRVRRARAAAWRLRDRARDTGVWYVSGSSGSAP